MSQSGGSSSVSANLLRYIENQAGGTALGSGAQAIRGNTTLLGKTSPTLAGLSPAIQQLGSISAEEQNLISAKDTAAEADRQAAAADAQARAAKAQAGAVGAAESEREAALARQRSRRRAGLESTILGGTAPAKQPLGSGAGKTLLGY